MKRLSRLLIAVIAVLGVLQVAWNDPGPVKADITCRDSGVNCRWVVVTPASEAGQVHICTVDVCANGFAGRTYQLEGDYAFDGPDPNATTTSSPSTSISSTTTSPSSSSSTSIVGADDSTSSTSTSTTVPSTSSSTISASSSSSTTSTTVFSVNCMTPGVVCGWAVVASDGVVHGVVVCTVDVCGSTGEWGGRLPVEYMGCPAGCRLILQAQQTSDGNVAGWHGSEVRYDDDSDTFSLPNGGSLKSGERLEDAIFPTTTVGPSTTIPSPPVTAEATETVVVNDTIYSSVDTMAIAETTVVLGEQSVTIDLPTIGVDGAGYEVSFDPDGPAQPIVLAEGVIVDAQSSSVQKLSVARPLRVVVSLRSIGKASGKMVIQLQVRGSMVKVSQFRLQQSMRFSTCSALRKVFPQGVTSSRSVSVIRKSLVVTSASPRPVVSPAIYLRNRHLDGDRDRIACER